MASKLVQGYIRHPNEIPAQISLCSGTSISTNTASHSGHIGISLATDTFYAIGTALEVTITISEPAFKASGHVAWCIPGKNNRFRTGLVFDDPATAYAVRMIEQICHIEQYRHEIEKSEGRHLTQEAAALEWVMHFAKDFPTLSGGIAHS